MENGLRLGYAFGISVTWVGNPEEAASGTANRALICWLVPRGFAPQASDGRGEIVAEQGFEMGRLSLSSVFSLTEHALKTAKAPPGNMSVTDTRGCTHCTGRLRTGRKR
jgi:hypothetical protein